MTPITDTATEFRITFDPAMIPGGRHALTSEYVETFWLPLLGPSSVVLLRALGRIYEPIAGMTLTPTTGVPIIQLGASLGLRGGITSNSKMGRTLTRLENFGFAQRTGHTTLTIGTYAPNLRGKQISRLPAFLQAIHPMAIEQHASYR